MHDIKDIRNRPDYYKKTLGMRSPSVAEMVDRLLQFDSERRVIDTAAQELRAQQNQFSKTFGPLAKSNPSLLEEKKTELQAMSTRLKSLAEDLKRVETAQENLLLEIPNTTEANVPFGKSADDNPVIATWGEKAEFAFEPKNHIALATGLQWIDFERATKIAGSGFILFTGPGARLQRGLINWMLDYHTSRGYKEVSVPYAVNRASLIGTGQLPKFENQLFALTGTDQFLIPTAEVPVANIHRGEDLEESRLPIRYCCYSPCFRSEAGAAGVGTRGLLRVHQFDKVELINLIHSEKGYEALGQMRTHVEKMLQELGLHYRVIELCTGDIGFGMAKTFDLEVWAPGQKAYLEVSSISNAETYQSRRMNLRVRRTDGDRLEHPHILNGSGIALPRLIVALLETYQQADGTVTLPEVLAPYLRSYQTPPT